MISAADALAIAEDKALTNEEINYIELSILTSCTQRRTHTNVSIRSDSRGHTDKKMLKVIQELLGDLGYSAAYNGESITITWGKKK